MRIDLLAYLLKVLKLRFQGLSGKLFFLQLFMQLRNICLTRHFAHFTLSWLNLRGWFQYCRLFFHLILSFNFIKDLLFHLLLLFCWDHRVNSIYVLFFFLLLNLLLLFQIWLFRENAWFLGRSWNFRSGLRNKWFRTSFRGCLMFNYLVKSLHIVLA